MTKDAEVLRKTRQGARVIRETGAHEKPGPQVTFSANWVSPLGCLDTTWQTQQAARSPHFLKYPKLTTDFNSLLKTLFSLCVFVWGRGGGRRGGGFIVIIH